MKEANTIKEAFITKAVLTTTPTLTTDSPPDSSSPEDLGAAKLALDQQAQSANDLTDSPEVQTKPKQPTVIVTQVEVTSIDQVRKQKLKIKFNETINNPRFWAKESRYDGVMSALVVPVFDDRSLHQYYIHADSDLNAGAAKKSKEDGVPAILPSEEEIKAEAWRRWVASETESVTKALNKKRREEAKQEGRKFIPVPAAEVQVIVAEAEAKLRASENHS